MICFCFNRIAFIVTHHRTIDIKSSSFYLDQWRIDSESIILIDRLIMIYSQVPSVLIIERDLRLEMAFSCWLDSSTQFHLFCTSYVNPWPWLINRRVFDSNLYRWQSSICRFISSKIKIDISALRLVSNSIILILNISIWLVNSWYYFRLRVKWHFCVISSLYNSSVSKVTRIDWHHELRISKIAILVNV